MSYGEKKRKNSSHCRFEHTLFILHAFTEDQKPDVEFKHFIRLTGAIHELNKYFNDKIAKRVEEKGISGEEIELIVLDVMQRLIVVPKALYTFK